MALVNYPQSFPVESVAYVVAVLRKQEAVDKAKMGLHGWQVQGYLMKLILGEPDTEAIHAGPLNVDAETMAIALESLDPEKPQPIFAGGLTKKLLFMALSKLIEKAIAGSDLPDGIKHLIDGLLGGE